MFHEDRGYAISFLTTTSMSPPHQACALTCGRSQLDLLCSSEQPTIIFPTHNAPPLYFRVNRGILSRRLCSNVELIVEALHPDYDWLEVFKILAATSAPRQARQEMQPRKLDFDVSSDEHGDEAGAAAKCTDGEGCVKDTGIGGTDNTGGECVKDTGIGGTKDIGGGCVKEIGDKGIKDIDTEDQQE
ncbi:hypothetical protein ElyMa_005849500 [Elysia marginata]|uniref:SAM-dependent MTase TRM10-type domain-containing protein n=1 Tax=Elysia marginata TaxID=1093978 RepID=A0AAV4G1B4_9GAST|nr:hypothetical protein ElyMa_005849500 [Elysia marginata]